MKQYISPFSAIFGDIEDFKDITEKINLDNGYLKGGYPLYSDTHTMLVSADDSHGGVSGMTGSKKTRSIMYTTICNLAKSDTKPSMIVHDTKGTVVEYQQDMLVEEGYNVITLNFRDTEKSDHYNVLDVVTEAFAKGETKKALRKLGDIGNQLIVPGLDKEDDKYWQTTTATYHDGLYKTTAVLSEYDSNYVNYNNIIHLHNLLAEDKSFRRLLMHKLRELGEIDIINNLESIWGNAGDTAKNLISMINNPFKTLQGVSNIMCKSDFSVQDLVDRPTCLFIVTPDESKEYNFIVSLLLKVIYGELIEIGSACEGATLKRTVHFLIDEFGSLPKITDFDAIISASRSRNIRFLLIYQTFSQLRSVYSETGARNILNNLSTLFCFRSNDPELEELLRSSVGLRTLPYSNREVEIIPRGTLRTLRKGEAIILAQGVKNPVKVFYPDITEYSAFKHQPSKEFNKVREHSPNLLDWAKVVSPSRDSDIEPEHPSKEDIAKSMLKDMMEREKYVTEISRKRRYPFVVVNKLPYIDKLPFDIMIKEIKFGKEYETVKALSKILRESELEVIPLVHYIYDDGNDVLIRCPNKKQYNEAHKALQDICKLVTYYPEGSTGSGSPSSSRFNPFASDHDDDCMDILKRFAEED